MFTNHSIVAENGKSYIMLQLQDFDCPTSFQQSIFSHLHEDVLWDWINDYAKQSELSLKTRHVKILAGYELIRELSPRIEFRESQELNNVIYVDFGQNS